MRKLVLVLMLVVFCSGCITNPQVLKLKEYEIRISEGRDKAFVEALEMTRNERVDIERQFIRKQTENNQLITVYVDLSNVPPEEAKKKIVMSIEDMIKIQFEEEVILRKRVEEINSTYMDFYEGIRGQDEKIKTIRESIKEIQGIQQETYMSIAKMFGSALAAVGLSLTIQ